MFVTQPDEVHSTNGKPSEPGSLYWLDYPLVQGGPAAVAALGPGGRRLPAALASLPTRHFRLAGPRVKPLFERLEELRARPPGSLRRVRMRQAVLELLLEVIDGSQRHAAGKPGPGHRGDRAADPAVAPARSTPSRTSPVWPAIRRRGSRSDSRRHGHFAAAIHHASQDGCRLPPPGRQHGPGRQDRRGSGVPHRAVFRHGLPAADAGLAADVPPAGPAPRGSESPPRRRAVVARNRPEGENAFHCDLLPRKPGNLECGDLSPLSFPLIQS